MLVRSDSEEIQSDWGCRARAAREDRKRRGYRQHLVAAAGRRWTECRRRGVSAPKSQGRPRNQRSRVDRLRCALCVLQRNGEARKAERRVTLKEDKLRRGNGEKTSGGGKGD